MPFRTRLFLILAAFAIVPSLVLTAGWGAAAARFLPLLGGAAAWERAADTGADALAIARRHPLTPAEAERLAAHERELASSLTQARRVQYLSGRAEPVVLGVAVLGVIVVGFLAFRTAGHLARQLSRPVVELVGWAERIANGAPLPGGPTAKGAPEFGLLRDGMRRMAAQLDEARARALEQERLATYRASAAQVAHELKNPLTAMRFALARLAAAPTPSAAEALEVLHTEAGRLEALAQSFAQFGRLPDGPTAPVDLGELVRYTVRATVPDDRVTQVDVAPGLPAVEGRYDALQRALANIVRNAVDATAPGGRIAVAVHRSASGVRVTVRDDGPGIAPEKLRTIWDPYVTGKPGGTGLGLAIARQAVETHGGTVFAEAAGGGATVGFELPVPTAGPT